MVAKSTELWNEINLRPFYNDHTYNSLRQINEGFTSVYYIASKFWSLITYVDLVGLKPEAISKWYTEIFWNFLTFFSLPFFTRSNLKFLRLPHILSTQYGTLTSVSFFKFIFKLNIFR